MKHFIANILWDALAMFLGRVHDWVFDPQRNARIRMRNRERWWAYHQKALATKDPRDDARANAWAIQFKFETSPEEAISRGDLNVDYVPH